MKNCKNCGASAPSSASQYTYICEYCNTKNVDEDYFKEIARTSDLGKSDRYAQLGINSYISDQFELAEKHFESSIVENDQNAQVWIYYALCKSSLLTASNFDKNIKAINDSISRAQLIDSDSEIVTSGRIAIFDKLVAKIAAIADYFFQTAHKNFVAFGRNREAAGSATTDLMRGIQRIAVLSQYHVVDSQDYAGLLTDGLGQCLFFEKKGASSSSLNQARQLIERELKIILDTNPELIRRTLGGRGEVGRTVAEVLRKSKPDLILEPVEKKKSTGFLSKFFS
jgi:hypothetical protein